MLVWQVLCRITVWYLQPISSIDAESTHLFEQLNEVHKGPLFALNMKRKQQLELVQNSCGD